METTMTDAAPDSRPTSHDEAPEGIEAFIQPGGSVRDKDSVAYCTEKKLAMVMTELRHFKH